MTFKAQPLLLNLGTLKGSKIIMRTFKDLRLPCNYELVFMSIPVAVNRPEGNRALSALCVDSGKAIPSLFLLSWSSEQ